MKNRSSRSLRTAVLVPGLSRRREFEEVLIPALKILSRQFEVVACFTAEKKIAQLLPRCFPNSRVYRQYTELFSEKKFDVAMVAGDGDDYYEICESAIVSGANLYSFSLPTNHSKDDFDLFRLACSENVLTGWGNHYQNVPAIKQARDLVNKRYLGQPLFFSMSYFGQSANDANARDARGNSQRELFERSIERIVSIAGLDIDAINVFPSKLNPASGQARNKPKKAGSCPAEVESYFLRLTDGSKGVLQVCGVCPSGTGERLELYGTEGMLMLTRPAHRPFGYHLTGARVDVAEILENATPPEKLKRKFPPLTAAAGPPPFSRASANKLWFGEALALSAFARAVRTGRPCAVNLAERFRLSCVVDAANRARSAQKWSPVKYRSIARPDQNAA